MELRDQQLYINGVPVAEDYGLHPAKRGVESAERMLALDMDRHHHGPVTVPDGHLFVLGDNWEMSADSRMYGAIPRDSLRGILIEGWGDV